MVSDKRKSIEFVQVDICGESSKVIVQSKFRLHFSSRTKKAEIGAKLDLLQISTLRSDEDKDKQALDKLIARLDKLSVMGTSDDMNDEHNIRRLHNAIAQDKWTYFSLCILTRIWFQPFVS